MSCLITRGEDPSRVTLRGPYVELGVSGPGMRNGRQAPSVRHLSARVVILFQSYTIHVSFYFWSVSRLFINTSPLSLPGGHFDYFDVKVSRNRRVRGRRRGPPCKRGVLLPCTHVRRCVWGTCVCVCGLVCGVYGVCVVCLCGWYVCVDVCDVWCGVLVSVV